MDQRLVFLGDRLAGGTIEHFGPQNRIVFRQRVVALEFKTGLSAAGNAVEEGGCFKGGDEGMADAAEHGVVAPDGEGVFAVLGELAGVVQGMALQPIDVTVSQVGRNCRIDTPFTARDIFQCDHCGDRRRVVASRIDPKDRVEDLHGGVGVHRGDDGGDLVQVAVDEFTGAAGVVDCALAVRAADV